jgi:predicted metal-binding integral membrane protein DUF2182/YtkA-like protein
LEQLGLLSPMMAPTSYWLGGAILVGAGLWQFTPIKDVCLRHCHSPMSFLIPGPPGRLGAARMGVEHGVYCLGCCWFLMGLLFFAGIMNLYWIVGLAVFVALERALGWSSRTSRAIGAALIVWGAITMTNTIAAPGDYRFEVAEVLPAGPGKTTVVVRLMHEPDMTPVEGAVIVDSKTDMGPSGMIEMSGKVTPLRSDQAGRYRFLIETGMTGNWQLILRAKVPDDAGEVGGAITYNAAK